MTFSITPNETQKSVLGTLLEKYNNSKTFKDCNKVRQSFCIRPGDVFPEYDDDFADAVKISEFDTDVTELENEGLVKIERHGRVIKRIYAVLENIPRYHELIEAMDKHTLCSKAQKHFCEAIWEEPRFWTQYATSSLKE